MALHRGIQSAIFYYVSCAPCAEMRVRKKRKQEAERDREDRAALELRMPGLYRHPEPQSTNPYWQSEIEAGPIPVRTRKKNAESKAMASSTKSNIASSVSVNATDAGMERSDSAKSGLGPHQRDDEALWGAPIPEDDVDELPARLPRARLADPPRSRYVQPSSNAAINDLHPPTTRKIRSKEEVMWMMQPPPIPEVMNGKIAAMTRSNSAESRPSTTSTARKSTGTSIAQDQATSISATAESTQPASNTHGKFLDVPSSASSIQRSNTLPGRNTQNDAVSAVRKPQPTLSPDSANHRAGLRAVGRPHLNTIHSEGMFTQASEKVSKDLRHSSVNTSDQASPVDRRRKASVDDLDPESTPNLETFESWDAPGFELPQWIHEHTKREVRERWSFDI